MPEVHRFYHEISNFVEGRLKVSFPGFARAPWSVACMTRGFEPIYMDLRQNQALVHKLMDFMMQSRIHFEKERSRFLGQDYTERNHYKYIYADYRAPAPSDLYDDELDGSILTPKTYKEFIYPYEKKLAIFYGEARYYHSCRNMTDFIPIIMKLPGLEMIHISAYSDLKEAVKLLDPKRIIIQKVMHPADDVLNCKEDEMYRKIMDILETTRGFKLYLCVDSIGRGPVENVKSWLDQAKRAIAESGRNLEEVQYEPKEGKAHRDI
jgi:uroporphyrinogen-III decarboxylase